MNRLDLIAHTDILAWELGLYVGQLSLAELRAYEARLRADLTLRGVAPAPVPTPTSDDRRDVRQMARKLAREAIRKVAA